MLFPVFTERILFFSIDEGLKEVFDDISPIADYGGKLSLEFIDFTYDEKDAKYSIEQCKERDVTYAAPLFGITVLENSLLPSLS